MKPLLALIALALPLHAAPRNVDVSFFCLRYAPGLETIHYPKDAASEEVNLSTANITAPVSLALDGEQAVFLQSGISNPKTPPPAAAKIRIPQNVTKALVVLVPNRTGAEVPYHALLVDQGDTFRLGSYRVINFSQRKIRGAIGRSYIEAASGAMSDLELKGEAGSVQGVKFEFEEEGRWNRLTETRCAVRKDRRWLLCVYQDPVTKRMNMKSIPDRTLLLRPASAETNIADTAAN